jgi:uncharacterized protein (DUF1330 family)
MAAYMIVLCQIHDRDRFVSEYAQPTAKLIASHGGEYVLRAPGVISLEGGFGDGMSAVISKWPDKAAIEGFWNSPEYKDLKAKRRSVSDAQVMMVEANT